MEYMALIQAAPPGSMLAVGEPIYECADCKGWVSESMKRWHVHA